MKKQKEPTNSEPRVLVMRQIEFSLAGLILLFMTGMAGATDDPWARLEDSPSMTCIDNEAELNRLWVDGGDLYWSDYGNVSAICRQLASAAGEGSECVVQKRDGSNQWYFKIAATDPDAAIVAENFFNFDKGEWDAIVNIGGFTERSTFPCW